MKTSKFKMTELGPIPEGWSVVSLGDLFSFKNGYNTSAECYGAGTPVASVLEALDWMPVTNSRIRTKVMAPEGARCTFSLKQGDLIFTRSSETLEDVGRSNVYVDDEPAMFGGFVIRGRPKTRNDSRFINFLLKDQKHHERVMSKGAGAQHYNIGQTGLTKVLITLPPLLEQERIAEALSDVDALLSAMTTLIEKKRAIKQGAMQQLLTGKTRLQGFGAACAEFKMTELGPIPVDWEVKRLGDVCSDYAYGTGAEAVDYDGENKYIRITDIDEDSHLYSPSPLVSPSFFSDGHIVKGNDLLIARTGASVGKTYFYSKSDGKLIFAGFLMKANVKHAEGKFIFYLTLTDYYKRWVLAESARSGQPGVNIRQLQSLLLPIPPLAEQQAIAAVLSDMDAEIAALEAKRAKSESIKQGMMQELLTGKTRLL